MSSTAVLQDLSQAHESCIIKVDFQYSSSYPAPEPIVACAALTISPVDRAPVPVSVCGRRCYGCWRPRCPTRASAGSWPRG